MLLVVGHLDLAAARRLVDGLAHGVRDGVRVHDDLALRVARGAADGLDERTAVAQKALFVRVEDGDQRDLRQVQALAQQVDANQHVDLAGAQVAQDLDAVQRGGVRVHVVDLDAGVEQVVGEVLGHALGERGDKHALMAGGADLYLVQQIIDLTAHGAHVDLGIEQAGGANDLLHVVLAHAQLVVARRGRDVDELRDARLELVEAKRAVVQGGRQAETVLDQRDLARAVALVHAADLRHGDVALIDDANHVLGEVVDERERGLAGLAAVQVARVVLDAVGEAHGLEHLQVVVRALLQALGLQELVLRLEFRHAVLQLFLDGLEGGRDLGFLGDVVRGGPHGDGVVFA